MKQKEAVQAYLSAKKLNEQETSAKTALKVFNLFTKLRKAWDFQVQEELKLFERYPEVDREKHGIKYSTKEEFEKAESIIKKFNEEADELADLDFEIDFEPFVIKLDVETGIKLSGADIGNLSEFIKFE